MLDGALWTHLVTVRHLFGQLRGRTRALWVEVTDGNAFGYRGMLAYDLVKMAAIRLAFGLGQEGRAHGITALAVTPGFLRSEEMLDTFGVTEATWRDAVASVPDFVASETPLFVGRCVAGLAADEQIARRNGRVYASWDLAREMGVRDADGSQPHWAEHFAGAYGRPFRAADADAYDAWEKDGMMEIVMARPGDGPKAAD
jgi:NAD(P)-dependent dehydrogenase (short-subunit alcohol dehydrogenase family)